jgi:AbrB family looped-hinge helix DNA binding protein
MRTTARVGINGRAQIPFDIRQKLGIGDGDQLIIEIEKVIHVNKDIREVTR